MIRRVLKHYLVPHEGNGYKPHFFHWRSAGVISLFLVVVFGFAQVQRFAVSHSNYLAAVLPGVLVDLANQDRQIYNLSPLTINPVLVAVAREKANDMARYSYFAHVSPSGITPWYWFSRVGYNFIYAGENLAINFDDSAVVNQAWMNSPGHRANILDRNFSEIGIATAEGVYEGRRTTFVVQVFGRPAAPANVVTTKVKPSEPKVKPIGDTRSLLAVRNVEAQRPQTFATPTPSVQSITKYATLPDQVLSSPITFMNIIYASVSILILLAILISLSMELKRHHARHVLSGVALLCLVLLLTYLYQYVGGSTIIAIL